MNTLASRLVIALGLVLGAILLSDTLDARQDPAADAPKTPVLRPEDIKAWMQTVEEATEISTELKAQLKTIYQAALTDVTKSLESVDRAEAFRQRTTSAPSDLEATSKEYETLSSAPELMPTLDATATSDQIDPALASAEATATQLKADLTAIDNEGKARDERRKSVPGLRAAEVARLEDAISKLISPAPATNPSDPAFANWIRMRAQEMAANTEIDSLDAEIASYDARVKLLRMRTDVVDAKLRRQTALVDRLRALAQTIRSREVEAERKKAEQTALDAANAHPEIKPIAETNVEIAKRREDLVARIDRANKRLTELQGSIKLNQDQFDQARKYIETVGLSDQLARVLQQPTENKAAARDHQRAIESREAELVELGLGRIDLERMRREVRDPAGAARAKLDEIVQDTDESGMTELRNMALDRRLRELFEARRDAIDAAIDDVARLTQLDLDLNQAERKLVQLTAEYQEYVDARFIWLRNTDAIGWAELRGALDRARRLPAEEQPDKTAKALFGDMVHSWYVYAAFILVLLVLSHYRRKLRDHFRDAHLEELGLVEAARPVSSGLFEAVIGALPIPLAMAFFSMRCIAISNANDPARAVAYSLQVGAMGLLSMLLLMRLMRRDGLFERFLGWPPESLFAMRHLTRALALVATPLVCFYYYFVARPTLEPSEPLARFCFIGWMISIVFYGLSVLKPVTRALQNTHRGEPGRVLRRRILVLVLMVYAPIAIAGLSAYGYHTTAHRVNERLFPTIVVFVGLMIAVQLFDSWFYLARRAEVLARLRKRREEMLAEQKARSEKKDESADGLEIPTLEVDEVDLRKLNAQARELVRGLAAAIFLVALWFVWSDVLPALRVLDTVTLWQVETASGVRAITIVDLFGALVALVLMWMIARNVPGLLEAAVLSKLPFDAGARYAIVTVMRYIITLIGIAVIFRRVGVGWEDFQWLVAAVSVGLGFGLQEIFGNFVSGIILLFERPLRVGDTVTVGGVSGVVTKIRMRATTILDGDNKEHIIPNKSMITGEVVNWVLTSPTIRVPIEIGVAYGTDTRKVEQLLLAIGRSHSEVVRDPAPSVVFNRFSDFSLDFVLSVFIKSPGVAGRVKTDIHRAIDEAFRRNGIQIPFPTREIIQRSEP